MQLPKAISNLFLSLRQKRSTRLITALAALVIVGLIIGAALLLFTGRTQARKTVFGRPGTVPVTFSTQKNGLKLSAAITPGPYFLSEMLGIELTLTNQSQNVIYAGTPFKGSACGYFSGIVITGGHGPTYQLPISFDHSCPPGLSRGILLQPGKSITVHTYEPLLSSGALTVTAQIGLLQRTKNPAPGAFQFQPIDVFNEDWPATHIQVSSTIPDDRQLSLQQDGDKVNITGPQAAQSDVVYAYGLGCGSMATGDATGTGNYSWTKVAKSAAPVSPPQDDYCAGKKIVWTYAFAAPGYALTLGTFRS